MVVCALALVRGKGGHPKPALGASCRLSGRKAVLDALILSIDRTMACSGGTVAIAAGAAGFCTVVKLPLGVPVELSNSAFHEYKNSKAFFFAFNQV